MRYVLCFIFPPAAVLMCAKPATALLNAGLCCLLILPGVIHALMVVSGHKADKRQDKLIKAINQNR